MNKDKLKVILNDDERAFNIKRDDSINIVNKYFIKKLRKKLDVTQLVFSSILGVSVKTIEKWEQGSVEPRNIVKKFLYLLDKKPWLINDFYSYKSHEFIPERFTYSVKNNFVRTVTSHTNKSGTTYATSKSFPYSQDVFKGTLITNYKNCCSTL